jgi:glycosyltransferase involved in cell wall biosynthesis
MASAPHAARSIVVIPCFNEAQRLDVAGIGDYLDRTPDVRLLFVDDGSTDRTAETLAQLRAGRPERIGVMALPRNRGKAEAVRLGVREALEAGCEFVGFWDADLSTPLRDIEVFARILEERPQLFVVFGSRVRLLGHRIDRIASRHYAGRVFATVVSLMLRLSVYDTQCGAKLFRATPMTARLFEEPFQSRWVFDVELIARLTLLAREQGLPAVEHLIYEHPLMEWRDVPGSKVNLRAYLKSAFDVYRIQRRYLRRRGASTSRPSR